MKKAVISTLLALLSLTIMIPASAAEIVGVGRVGNMYAYRINDVYVIAAVGSIIDGCLLVGDRGLDCSDVGLVSGQGVSQKELGADWISTTLEEKNRLILQKNKEIVALNRKLQSSNHECVVDSGSSSGSDSSLNF